jgi:hypothetical protein
MSILNLFRSLERIESFLSINVLALRKICKKFDKHIPSPSTEENLSAQVVPYVEKFEMKHKTQLDNLLEEIEKVGMERLLVLNFLAISSAWKTIKDGRR